MEYSRITLIKLLTKLYGPSKGEDRIDFLNFTSKEIATDLGYDESQFSRILNPGIGKEPSVDSYQKIITRVLQNLENKKIKEENIRLKWWRIIALSTILALIMFIFAITFLKRVDNVNLQKGIQPENVLDVTQIINFLELHGVSIQNQLAVQGLLFNLKIREKKLTLEEEQVEMKKLEQDVKLILERGRSKIESLRFMTADGESLKRHIEKCYSLDSDSTGLKNDFRKVIPHLVNKDIEPQELVKMIKNQADEAQLILRRCVTAAAENKPSE